MTKHGIIYFEFQAVFQTLCRLKLTKHELMPGSGIIITVLDLHEAEEMLIAQLIILH